MANLTRNYSQKAIDRVNKFFNRESLYKQFKTMISFLIPDKSNVKLTLNIGGGSFTDGKSITVGLPEMFIEKSYEEMFSALRALIGHESQHINSSDFDGFVNFQKEISEYFFKKHKIPHFYGKKVAKHLLNSVEDGRIENILCNKLPGYVKHIQFLNGSFWEAQEMKGNSELEDFLYSITTYSVTGLYPKGFKKVYAGTELHENMKKIENDIHKGIQAVTARQCTLVCHEIIEKTEDYLVKLLINRSQEDEEFLRNLSDQSEYTTSEEKEKNTSGDVSPHFKPKKKDKKEEKKQTEENEQQEGSSSDSEENQEDKDEKEKGKGKGKDNKKDQDEEEDAEGQGKGDKEEEDKNSESEGEGNSDKEDEKSEEESKENSDKSEEENSEEGSGGNSDESSNSDEPQDPNEESETDEIPDSESEYPQGVNQDEDGDDDMEIDEDEIRERMKEITDEVMEEAKSKLEEEKPKKNKSSQKDKGEEISMEDLQEIESQYKSQSVKKFKELKGFPNRYSLPVEIKREGTKFRKEVEKIFQNKESYNLRAQKKGVLDTANLWKFGVKDYNMFMKKGTPVTTDYVAFILQDGSGSMMDGNKEFHSAKAMSVMEEGLKGIIPFKVSTFSVDYSSRSVLHFTAKDWNENNSSQNYSYNFHRSRRAGGGNKDGYSIRIATAELMKRPEKDKILIVLSDGLPSDYNGGQKEGMVDVKQAVKEARKKGIHVVSLIFGSEDFRDYNIENYKFMYDKNIISSQPEQITTNLVKMLKKIIAR